MGNCKLLVRAELLNGRDEELWQVDVAIGPRQLVGKSIDTLWEAPLRLLVTLVSHQQVAVKALAHQLVCLFKDVNPALKAG